LGITSEILEYCRAGPSDEKLYADYKRVIEIAGDLHVNKALSRIIKEFEPAVVGRSQSQPSQDESNAANAGQRELRLVRSFKSKERNILDVVEHYAAQNRWSATLDKAEPLDPDLRVKLGLKANEQEQGRGHKSEIYDSIVYAELVSEGWEGDFALYKQRDKPKYESKKKAWTRRKQAAEKMAVLTSPAKLNLGWLFVAPDWMAPVRCSMLRSHWQSWCSMSWKVSHTMSRFG
jgi:hypothetical protein